MSQPAYAETPAVQIDIGRVMEMIPHRHPFLMIDKIVDAVADERATGIKNVSINEHYFQGHFPKRPVMPGVLIIEAMAQTAAVLVVHTLGPEAEGKLVYFMSVDNARFRRPVVPGDTLVLEVTALRTGSRIQRMRGEAKVDGQVCADAELTSVIADRES
jgi:3-hydroxyacyl-[acyl-carrier-protein] dehydratase